MICKNHRVWQTPLSYLANEDEYSDSYVNAAIDMWV